MTGTGTIEVAGYNAEIVEIAEPIKVGNDIKIILTNYGASNRSNSFTAISPGGYKWLLTDLALSSGALTDATITVTTEANSFGIVEREASGVVPPPPTEPTQPSPSIPSTGDGASHEAVIALVLLMSGLACLLAFRRRKPEATSRKPDER
jgi:LPXTG-motif cell wall-anchored protein